MRMSKTLANPLRRPPGHLMGSRSQIRVTTPGRSHINIDSGPSKREKKPFGVGAGRCARGEGGVGASRVLLGCWREGGRRLFLVKGVKEMAQ